MRISSKKVIDNHVIFAPVTTGPVPERGARNVQNSRQLDGRQLQVRPDSFTREKQQGQEAVNRVGRRCGLHLNVSPSALVQVVAR